MSPVEVREALLAAGFDFSNYTSNPLSSIHTTLKRMMPDELISETRADGQVYRWAAVAGPYSLVPMNTPGTSYQKIGVDSQPDSAFTSGMRGNEKPKK